MPRNRFAAIFVTLFYALVTGIAERGVLVTVQQRLRLRNIRDIASRDDDGMQQN